MYGYSEKAHLNDSSLGLDSLVVSDIDSIFPEVCLLHRKYLLKIITDKRDVQNCLKIFA